MELTTRFTFDKVKYDQENTVHLVVSIKAPKTDWQKKRAPICIIPVIDVSSSMTGEKLDFAKKSADKLIEHLQPGDFCGVVVFDDNVATIAPPMEMTQQKKDELRAKVGRIGTNGCTNFSGGMLEGLGHANKSDLPEGLLKRNVMLTDGQANRGIAVTRTELLPLLEKSLGKATMSCFGYGADADQELLADLAKTGNGNYAFIQTPDAALSAFAKELGGLLSVYAQNLRLELHAHNGHTITEVLSDVDVEEKETGKAVLIKIPEILGEEERQIVIACKLSAQANPLPRVLNVFDAKLTYDVLDDKGKKTEKTVEAKAKMLFVKDGEQQDKPTPEVDAIVGLAQLVKVTVESEKLAQQGDFHGAQMVASNYAGEMKTRGHIHLEGLGRKLMANSASAHAYAGSRGYATSMKNAATRGVGTSGMDNEAFADLAGAGVCSASPAQEFMVQSFTGGDGGAAGAVNVGGGHFAGAAPGAGPFGGGGVVMPPVPAAPPAAPAKPAKAQAKGLSKKRSTKRW